MMMVTCASNASARTGERAGSIGRQGAGGVTHRLAEREHWPWLPTQGPGHLAPHPYCQHCGQVRAVGTNRALDHGGLVNLLANLQRRLRDHNLTMTEVQRRLILKRLIARDVADPFGLTRATQLGFVASVAAPILGLQREVLASYLCSC